MSLLPDQQLLSPDERRFRSSPFGLEFTVYGQAQPAGSKRALPMRGKAGARAIVVDANPKAKPWKDDVAQVAGTLMRSRDLFEGPLVMVATFYQPRPKGHFGKKGLLPSASKFPVKKPDVTKLLRGVEDALTGVVWRDDAQVIDQHAFKRFGEPARVEVKISVIP